MPPANRRVVLTASAGGATIDVDEALLTRVSLDGVAVTTFDPSEVLLVDGTAVEEFAYRGHEAVERVHPHHGRGVRTTVHGDAPAGVRKTVVLTSYERLPGMVVLEATFTNASTQPVRVTGWRTAAHELPESPGGFFTFSGATHTDRRDWVHRVTDTFDQVNFLGMDSSDYGGGTPVATVWRRDAGLCVGHLEPVVRALSLPVRRTSAGASIAVEDRAGRVLAPGGELVTATTFVMAHHGDHFVPLERYRDYLAGLGLRAPAAPVSAFEPVWCAWGYERDFTVEQVVATLPKVAELGLRWAVLDDGWQTNEGDWELHPEKFPRGDEDMRALTARIREHGLRPRLWWAPLAADPASDVHRLRPDMLLLGSDGEPQRVTWWDDLTLCPAYQPTIDHFVAQARRFVTSWGFEGLKLDGQHLNAVGPCFNPAHGHVRPEESTEGLARFWEAIYDVVHAAAPDAVVEFCPCGTALDFHNLPFVDQYPSADPLSSFQVRSKGKSVKALMGTGSSYAGDHVELSDGQDDFASSYGVGAVLSTKFAYPAGPDPQVVLTPEKDALWRRWIALDARSGLTTGEYRGELYDIGFDVPEGHAIAKGTALHYAFFADRWSGAVELRGLGPRTYRLTDPFHDTDLGVVAGPEASVDLTFTRFQLVVAEPA
ncbi:glycoside hydrolase family 36 protein [Cellulomonas alba]|uniref:Alpha-galactosidase n=1 Tax=Cellulomonas alba TaxID=3053467 RepID=A0ABT7SIJ6_9CELL|nr:glycoside hydrolase family 36 protein [Cellulomonas alba]MDM7856003.1 alpha-galactosidase [Cellulomonas alba]